MSTSSGPTVSEGSSSAFDSSSAATNDPLADILGVNHSDGLNSNVNRSRLVAQMELQFHRLAFTLVKGNGLFRRLAVILVAIDFLQLLAFSTDTRSIPWHDSLSGVSSFLRFVQLHWITGAAEEQGTPETRGVFWGLAALVAFVYLIAVAVTRARRPPVFLLRLLRVAVSLLLTVLYMPLVRTFAQQIVCKAESDIPIPDDGDTLLGTTSSSYSSSSSSSSTGVLRGLQVSAVAGFENTDDATSYVYVCFTSEHLSYAVPGLLFLLAYAPVMLFGSVIYFDPGTETGTGVSTESTPAVAPGTPGAARDGGADLHTSAMDTIMDVSNNAGDSSGVMQRGGPQGGTRGISGGLVGDSKKNPLARIHSREEMFFMTLKTIVTILAVIVAHPVTAEDIPWLDTVFAIVLLVVPIAMLCYHALVLPYFSRVTNKVRAGLIAALAWSGLCGLATIIIDDRTNAGTAIALYAGIFPAFVAGALIVGARITSITNRARIVIDGSISGGFLGLAQLGATADDIDGVDENSLAAMLPSCITSWIQVPNCCTGVRGIDSREEILLSQFEYEIAARLVPRPRHIAFAEFERWNEGVLDFLKVATTKWPNSPLLRAALITKMADLGQAERAAREVEGMRAIASLAFDWRYFVFRWREDERFQRSSSGVADMDLMTYVEFQNDFRNAQTKHALAQRHITAFWRGLLHGRIEPTEIEKYIIRIESASQRATSIYMGLLRRFPRSVRIFRAFGRFLEDVKQDEDSALRCYSRADDIEQEETDANVDAGQASGTMNAIRAAEEDGIPVAVVDAELTILIATKALGVLIGVSSHALVGRNFAAIVPRPYTQNAKGYLLGGSHTRVSDDGSREHEMQIRNSAGETVAVAATVTETQQAHSTVYLCKFVTIKDAISRVTLDSAGVIAGHNTKFLKTFGYSHESLVGRKIGSIIYTAEGSSGTGVTVHFLAGVSPLGGRRVNAFGKGVGNNNNNNNSNNGDTDADGGDSEISCCTRYLTGIRKDMSRVPIAVQTCQRSTGDDSAPARRIGQQDSAYELIIKPMESISADLKVDDEGYILECNQDAALLFGRPRRGLINTDAHAMVPAPLKSVRGELFGISISNNAHNTMTSTHTHAVRADGSLLPIVATKRDYGALNNDAGGAMAGVESVNAGILGGGEAEFGGSVVTVINLTPDPRAGSAIATFRVDDSACISSVDVGAVNAFHLNPALVIGEPFATTILINDGSAVAKHCTAAIGRLCSAEGGVGGGDEDTWIPAVARVAEQGSASLVAAAFPVGILATGDERLGRDEHVLTVYRADHIELLIYVDESGEITHANDGLGPVLGYAADDIIGRNISVFFPGLDRLQSKEEVRVRDPVTALHASGIQLPVIVDMASQQQQQALRARRSSGGFASGGEDSEMSASRVGPFVMRVTRSGGTMTAGKESIMHSSSERRLRRSLGMKSRSGADQASTNEGGSSHAGGSVAGSCSDAGESNYERRIAKLKRRHGAVMERKRTHAQRVRTISHSIGTRRLLIVTYIVAAVAIAILFSSYGVSASLSQAVEGRQYLIPTTGLRATHAIEATAIHRGHSRKAFGLGALEATEINAINNSNNGGNGTSAGGADGIATGNTTATYNMLKEIMDRFDVLQSSVFFGVDVVDLLDHTQIGLDQAWKQMDGLVSRSTASKKENRLTIYAGISGDVEENTELHNAGEQFTQRMALALGSHEVGAGSEGSDQYLLHSANVFLERNIIVRGGFPNETSEMAPPSVNETDGDEPLQATKRWRNPMEDSLVDDDELLERQEASMGPLAWHLTHALVTVLAVLRNGHHPLLAAEIISVSLVGIVCIGAALFVFVPTMRRSMKHKRRSLGAFFVIPKSVLRRLVKNFTKKTDEGTDDAEGAQREQERLELANKAKAWADEQNIHGSLAAVPERDDESSMSAGSAGTSDHGGAAPFVASVTTPKTSPRLYTSNSKSKVRWDPESATNTPDSRHGLLASAAPTTSGAGSVSFSASNGNYRDGRPALTVGQRSILRNQEMGDINTSNDGDRRDRKAKLDTVLEGITVGMQGCNPSRYIRYLAGLLLLLTASSLVVIVGRATHLQVHDIEDAMFISTWRQIHTSQLVAMLGELTAYPESQELIDQVKASRASLEVAHRSLSLGIRIGITSDLSNMYFRCYSCVLETIPAAMHGCSTPLPSRAGTTGAAQNDTGTAGGIVESDTSLNTLMNAFGEYADALVADPTDKLIAERFFALAREALPATCGATGLYRLAAKDKMAFMTQMFAVTAVGASLLIIVATAVVLVPICYAIKRDTERSFAIIGLIPPDFIDLVPELRSIVEGDSGEMTDEV